MPTDQYGNDVPDDSAAASQPNIVPYLAEALDPNYAGTGGPPDSPPFESGQSPEQLNYAKAAPAIAQTQQYAQMLKRLTAPEKPQKVKMPWWGYALGGLADLGSFLSYKHATRPRNVEIGRNEFGGRVHQRIHPVAAAPSMSGLATALTAPWAANRRNDLAYRQALAGQNRAIMPAVAQFGSRAIGAALAQPKPAPVPPLQQTLTILRQEDQQNAAAGHPTNYTQAYLNHFVAQQSNSAPDNKLKIAQAWKEQLDEYERVHGKAARQDLERIANIPAVQKGTPKAPKPGESGLTASDKRLIDAKQAPIKAQIVTIQRQIDALRRAGIDDPATEQSLQDKIDHLTEQLDYVARGIPGVGRKLWDVDPYSAGEEETTAEDAGEGGTEEPVNTTGLPQDFNPYDPTDMNQVPPDLVLPNGHKFSDYAAVWDQMTPEDQHAVWLEADKALQAQGQGQ